MRGRPRPNGPRRGVFYDDQQVYVGARLWDSAPESQWIANEMVRDSFQLVNNDYFSVAFDTFYDRRNGVSFMVNRRSRPRRVGRCDSSETYARSGTAGADDAPM